MFCPVDERYRLACECKLTETLIVDTDGFAWTNPTDGPCRGCELAALDVVLARAWGARPFRMLRQCPVHGQPPETSS